MEVLVERLRKKQPNQTAGLVAKKVRTVGRPSDSLPPPGAPTWAVKKTDSQNGKQCVHTLLNFILSLSPSPFVSFSHNVIHISSLSSCR